MAILYVVTASHALDMLFFGCSLKFVHLLQWLLLKDFFPTPSVMNSMASRPQADSNLGP
jgi:hypothetical protein